MVHFGKLGLRAVQVLFMAVIIGLSASLIKGQYSGNVPSITSFALVCGVWGALVAIIGFAATTAESFEGLPMVVLDGIATLFFLSGSIAMAAKLGVGSCDGSSPPDWPSELANPYCILHGIINGGAFQGNIYQGWVAYEESSWFVSRCRMAQADVAFLFFGVVAFAASLVLSFLAWKRAGTKLSAV